MQPMTVDQFKQALPDRVKKSVNQEIVNRVNATLSDPDLYEQYRDNLIGYSQVMREGKFKLSSYIDAVKYVSHKLMGKTNMDAYSSTFPDKIQRWTAQKVAAKDMASYVTAYNKSKLVGLIMEQSLVPSWVLNQDLYQKALNVQAELMITSGSDKVRTDAANSLLTHLKMPETHKVELDVGVKQDSTIDALRQSTAELVAQQKRMLQAGAMSATEVAHSKLVIEGEAEEVQ